MQTDLILRRSLISYAVDYPRSKAGTRQDRSYLFVRDIFDAVSLRNDWVRFFYYGQFNGHHIICRGDIAILTSGAIAYSSTTSIKSSIITSNVRASFCNAVTSTVANPGERA